MQLTVIDINNPSRPILEKETTIEVSGKTIADAEVGGDYAAVAITNGSTPGVDIYDIRDYKSPKQITHIALENSYLVRVVGKNLFVGTAAFRMQGGYFFVDAASLVILDVSIFAKPLQLGVVGTVDLLDDLLIEGNTAYLMGNYDGGFAGSYWVQAVNVSKPNQPALRNGLKLENVELQAKEGARWTDSRFFSLAIHESYTAATLTVSD